MIRPLVVGALVVVATSAAASCALLSGAYACSDDTNCPTGDACNASGVCVAAAGEGEAGEGEGTSGEGEGTAGEGEGASGEGEGEGAAGEGEGEGEGEGTAGEGEGEGEGAPACEQFNNDVFVSNNGGVNNLGFSGSCVDVFGDVTITGNVNSLGALARIHDVHGIFTLDGPALTSGAVDGFTQLHDVDNDVLVQNMGSGYTTITLGSLHSVGGTFTIFNNGAVRGIALPDLVNINGDLDVQDNGQLCSQDANALHDLVARITLGGNESNSNNGGCN